LKASLFEVRPHFRPCISSLAVASWSESILAKTEGSQILSTYQAFWIGTVSTTPPIQNEQEKEVVRSILQEMNCIPLFLDAATTKAHYFGFCKQVLWRKLMADNKFRYQR
jgi:trehalose-6-phosphate synthase